MKGFKEAPRFRRWLMVVVQLAVSLGATFGGLVFDALGPILDFSASAAILAVAALVAVSGRGHLHLRPILLARDQ